MCSLGEWSVEKDKTLTRVDSTPNQLPKRLPRPKPRLRRLRVLLNPPKSQTMFNESLSSERRMPRLILFWRVSLVLVVCTPPSRVDRGKAAGVTGTSWKARSWR